MTERADVSETEEWARSVWRMLVEGGTWGVPRTGLIFQKRDGKLHLITLLPWHPSCGVDTADQLREQQDFDIDGVRRMFAQIGIEVVGDE
jgi:hypothetical protein